MVRGKDLESPDITSSLKTLKNTLSVEDERACGWQAAYGSVVVVYLLRCALARDGWTRRGERRASDDAVSEKSLENSMQCNLISCSCQGI